MYDRHTSFPLQILRLPDVIVRTGMQKSYLYREVAAGRFPQPVKIGRASGWDAAAVEAWIRTKLAAVGQTSLEV